MKSRATRRFREMLSALPRYVQRQAVQAYKQFAADPHHPGLRFKQVHTDPITYSARVGIGYRAVGGLDVDTVVWYWIGTHAEYERLLKQL